MQTTVEDLSPIRKKIAVALPPEEVQAEIDEAYRGLQRRARIKGFRPGKVPRPILEKYFGEQVRSEVIGKLIQDSLGRALVEHDLRAVARPEIVAEEVRPDAGLRYSATIEIKPAITLAGYGDLAVEREVPAVAEEAIDTQLERLRESMAQMEPVPDRDAVERGDLVEIAYTGVVDGRALAGAASSGRVIEVGAQTFPPPFEERLIGLGRGATTHIEVPYPAHHHAREVAGKTVVFRVEVKEIGRKRLPVLDDDFAKDHGECGSLEELRAKLRSRLEERAAEEADENVRAALVRQLAERNPIDVPEAMVERRYESMAREVGIHGVDAGVNAELAAQLEQIRAGLRQRARDSVHSSLLLERLATQEHLEVADSEVDERIAALLRTAPRGEERLADLYRAPEARREIRDRLAQEKALAWLVAHAAVTEANPSRRHQT